MTHSEIPTTAALYLSTSSSSPSTRATATTLAAMIASIRHDLDLPYDPSSSPFGNLPPIKPTSLLDLGLFQTPLPATASPAATTTSSCEDSHRATPTLPRQTKKQKLRHTIDEALSIISDGGRRRSSSN